MHTHYADAIPAKEPTMEHITITATVAVWLPSYHRPTELLAALEAGDAVRVASKLFFYGGPEMESFSDYARVGEAEVTMRLLPRDEQTRMAVEALKAKGDKLRAAYLTAQQEILEQISKLQALDYVEG